MSCAAPGPALALDATGYVPLDVRAVAWPKYAGGSAS